MLIEKSALSNSLSTPNINLVQGANQSLEQTSLVACLTETRWSQVTWMQVDRYHHVCALPLPTFEFHKFKKNEKNFRASYFVNDKLWSHPPAMCVDLEVFIFADWLRIRKRRKNRIYTVSPTCSHDPIDPSLPQTPFHVATVLYVAIGKHRDGHALSVGQRRLFEIRRLLTSGARATKLKLKADLVQYTSLCKMITKHIAYFPTEIKWTWSCGMQLQCGKYLFKGGKVTINCNNTKNLIKCLDDPQRPESGETGCNASHYWDEVRCNQADLTIWACSIDVT